MISGYVAHLTCSKAALVGGMFCLAKIFLHALLMSQQVLVLSYIRITNLSTVCMISSSMPLLHIVLPCKNLSACFVDVTTGTSPVVYQVHKPIYCLHDIFIYATWCAIDSRSSTCTSVNLGKTFHVAHAVFLLCQTELESVSQPVRACNIGYAFSGSSVTAIL